MHGIFMGELQALEGAGRTLWDFPDAPWEFKMNMARQCWDEARHVQIYEKLLSHVGGYVGMFPESTFLFEAACADDPVLRVAGVNRGLEGLACDVFRDMIKYAEKTGDDVMQQAVDYVLADELTHVRFGSEWVREFTKDDPDARHTREGVPARGRQEVQHRRHPLGARRRVDSRRRRRPQGGGLHRRRRSRSSTRSRPRGRLARTLRKAAAILRERHLRAASDKRAEVAA